MQLTASLSPTELAAEPGVSAAFTLEVSANGAGPQDLRFEVLGPAGEWAMVVPPQASVPAGGQARVRVMLQVPRSPHVAPGPTPVTVRVAAAGRPGDAPAQADVHGVVRVQPFAEVRASLSPRASRGRTAGRHVLHVENLGNEAVAASIEGTAADGGLVVDLARAQVAVAPGEVASVPVTARPRGRRFLGRPRSRAFEVTVRTDTERDDGGPAVAAEGLLVQERLRWPVPAALTLTGLAVVAGLALRGRGGDDAPQVVPAGVPSTAAAGTPAQTATCPPTPADAAGELLVQNFLFCPATVTVARGSELRWVNQDGAAHTVSADGDVFDTGSFARGERRSVRFDSPGTFSYFCRLHPFMRGTVVVTG